jgi:tripartite-type tricarboxylate transporter receptor subunit TctC
VEKLKRRDLFFSSIALGTFNYSSSAYSGNYPDRPIKIVQGFAPGGNADNIARTISNEMSKGLNQAFVIEAQSGAGGTIAANTVAKSKPDGYTLLLATGGHSVAGALYANLPYKTVSDFEMISTITFFPFLIVTSADSRIKSFTDLVNLSKAGTEGLNYGSAGIGSTHHLAGELLSRMGKLNLLHVPYRGDAGSVSALLANDVSFIIAPPTAVISNIKAGKLKALATTGIKRWTGLPELPTVAEQGVDGYDVRSWAGLMAPANTPKSILARLNQEVIKTLQSPLVRTRLEDMGGDVQGSTPEEMKDLVSLEWQRWTKVVTEAKITKQ